MEIVRNIFDVLLHLNQHLQSWTAEYGVWVYGILFLIVFCETGLVVTPFLPGDSLLFAVGALAGGGTLSAPLAGGLIFLAAVLGDAVNYFIGSRLGEVACVRWPRLIRREYLDRTHSFFERYGGKTIIIARFVPIVRTFAPFVAGAGRMTYRRFMAYNVSGAALWVVTIVGAGFWFGQMEWVKKNFSAVVLAIIVISILPAVFEVWREWRRARQPAK
ncbi:MAG: DedA family protein [Pedosphaera sp.]|nr:DedA family protein [Pedosphaera sp.]MSU43009.1 DedA family protein [Pedosphaera sp.]